VTYHFLLHTCEVRTDSNYAVGWMTEQLAGVRECPVVHSIRTGPGARPVQLAGSPGSEWSAPEDGHSSVAENGTDLFTSTHFTKQEAEIPQWVRFPTGAKGVLLNSAKFYFEMICLFSCESNDSEDRDKASIFRYFNIPQMCMGPGS
jgi:hypothetical protein